LEVSGGRGLSIGPPLCPEALASQTVVGMNVAKIELKKKSNTQTSTQSSPKKHSTKPIHGIYHLDHRVFIIKSNFKYTKTL